MPTGLANPQVIVNGLSVSIVPNSFSYTEGIGEQTVKTQSSGGSAVEQVFFDNAETKISMVKFDLYSTAVNIELARIWKTAADTNSIEFTGSVKGEPLDRVMTFAALTNDYEVELKNEGIVSLEFHGRGVI